MHRMLGVAAVAALLGLAACATATPYQPVGKSGEGYSEQRLESNRFRVRFTGSSATPRQTVEDYLTYRAAELTLQHGYDWFMLVDSATHVDPQRSSAGPDVGIGFGGGSGHFGTGISIGLGSLIGGGSRAAYQGQADVLMFRGARPADDAKALDARQVKAHLESAVQRR